MALSFLGILPHSPLLLSSVAGSEETAALAETKAALEKLTTDVHLAHPDIVVVISPYVGLHEEAFTLHTHDTLTTDLSDFGDTQSQSRWRGATHLTSHIIEEANKQDIPVQLDSGELLDAATSVALHALFPTPPNTTLLPIGFSGLDYETHMKFGEVLRDVILHSPKRVAVVVAAELSHTLTESAPGGYHEDGELFDQAILDALQARRLQNLLTVKESVIENADQTAYLSLLLTAGLLGESYFTFDLLSYEHPFGVGYLTGQFHF